MSVPTRCDEKCWTPVPCPTCGRSLPPRGRSVPLALYVADCCDDARHDSDINPRHLWDSNDEERWRFYPDEAPWAEGADGE